MRQEQKNTCIIRDNKSIPGRLKMCYFVFRIGSYLMYVQLQLGGERT